MEIKNENYCVIQGYMINDLKLKGNDLLIYALISGFCQTENQYYTGSLQYLAEWTNSTKQGILKNLKSLENKGLIEKKIKFVNGIKFCMYSTKFNRGKQSLMGYSTKFNGGIQQSLMGYSTKFNGGIQQSLPNNINDNIDKNIDDNIDDNIEDYKGESSSEFLSVFMKLYNIERDITNLSTVRDLDFKKVLIAFGESRWLKDEIKSLRWIVNNYQKIVRGDYKDKPKLKAESKDEPKPVPDGKPKDFWEKREKMLKIIANSWCGADNEIFDEGAAKMRGLKLEYIFESDLPVSIEQYKRYNGMI